MSKVELTNMIMIQNPETGEVVVQRRIKYWCGCTFPGGHVENGESIYNSAVREAKEETGLTVRNLKYCGMMHWHNTDTNDKYFVHFYKTNDFEGTLIDKSDEGEVFFASIEDLKGLPDAMILNGEADVLRDEGEAYARKLRRAGVEVTAVRYQAIIHDFVMLNVLDQTQACRAAMDSSTEWINRKNKCF